MPRARLYAVQIRDAKNPTHDPRLIALLPRSTDALEYWNTHKPSSGWKSQIAEMVPANVVYEPLKHHETPLYYPRNNPAGDYPWWFWAGMGASAFLILLWARRARGAAFLADGSGSPMDPNTAAITSPYGTMRGGKPHGGTDIAMHQPGACQGQPVYAVSDGVVHYFGANHPEAGNFIEINHAGGVQTRYLHLSRSDVRAGDVVTRGQRIGNCGSTGHATGPHLHFEVKVNGRLVDPASVVPAIAALPRQGQPLVG